ncbi:hypothetical protein GQ457_11G005240 [Hibiscus cannabinus]
MSAIMVHDNVRYEGIKSREGKKSVFTRRLKPVTLQNAVAMATPDSASSPRCPAIIIDTTCKRYCDSATATNGAATKLNFLSSSTATSHVSISLILPPFFRSNASSIFLFSFSVLISTPLYFFKWNAQI